MIKTLIAVAAVMLVAGCASSESAPGRAANTREVGNAA